MAGPDALPRFPVDDVLAFGCRVLEALSVPADDAHEVSSCLVEADLRGVGSHGLVRLPVYARRIRAGVVKARPAVRFTSAAPATALADGDNGLGPAVGARAMLKALELAEAYGVGMVGTCHSNHFGPASRYVQKAVDRGCIGFACSNAPPNMAPYGGRMRFLGTNPFAVGVPAGRERPLIFDASSSVVARGKIIVAAHSGSPIPEGWAIDPEGRPTTNAQTALEGAVLPFGGPKGSAISFLIDILCGVMTGAGFAHYLNTLEDLSSIQNLGHTFAALRADLFMPAADFARRMEEILGMLRASPPAPGVERILVPGEIEYMEEMRNRELGVPLVPEVVAQLVKQGEEVGVPFPAAQSGTKEK
ncbi:MAG: Ldh family oxidoreductase [Bryobacterales bacterium]|nr:Ldh family oxidoreductase [Bryobacterales bacterium]